ncbi:endonuclease [Pseudalgibacter alginicilyticus]|uniref:Endonuclease n=1 Tax=Pseudalgibacter alginicilyticus TaxID=1736674 RepID=A0A0P0CHE6_9FLAO|nr:DUF4837 family protein [Pseudalgibacter alginicilyticus]ALJ05593.1 endonuclease [Pseudalgibacter alginicilyticus]
MRKIILITFVSLFVIGCKDNKTSKEKYLPDSSGNLNSVSVVVDNDMWSGDVGEAIRNVLATVVDGLPQDEPMFSMSQIPPSVFSGFVTKNRTVLKVVTNKESGVFVTNDVYAKPQKVVTVSGQTKEDLIAQINNNSEKIIEAFTNSELSEKLRRIDKSLHNYTSIEEKLGLTIKFPSVYRIAKEEGKFFWIRKDITTGSMDLLLYELPYNAIKRNDSMVKQIIRIRDSVNKEMIPGPDLEPKPFMVTEKAYTPFHFETILDNKPVLETKGIWDMQNAFMAGPFVNYAIEDKVNNRWVVIEGFVFAPSVEKRDYMFEIEAIIKSVKIK